MTALNDLKQALSGLQSTVADLNNGMQARIDAAVAAKEAQDDAAFNEAIQSVRDMTNSLAQQTAAVHQTATAIAPTDLPPVSAVPAADTAAAAAELSPPVQTTQTATTDPTGTAAAASTVGNVPDGAMSTAAPGATVDPLTSAPVAQASDVIPATPVAAVTATDPADVPTAAPATDPAEPAAPAEPASPAPAAGSEDETAPRAL